MSVTALFATTGATNAGLYPTQGLSEHLASTGQFPPLMGGKVGGRVPNGLLIASAAIIVMVIGLDLSSIASIGSAIALMIFAFVTIAHLRGVPGDRRTAVGASPRAAGDLSGSRGRSDPDQQFC
jgi:L-asparagine transporter-like permease